MWAGSPPSTPLALLGRARDHARLHDALATLPLEQAEVLRATFVQGLSLADYAHATGLPLGTVKTRARLAMQRLRTLLMPPTEPDEV